MAFHPTDQQLEAIPLLASGQSYARVAEAVGTSKATICRWLKNDEFRQQVESLQQQKLEISQNTAKESSISRAEQLQATLDTASRHQIETAETTRQLTKQCLALTMELVQQVDSLFKKDSDEGLTPKQKALLSFTPNLMRSTAILISAGNDTWDRAYGITEIAKRIDEWQMHWSESERN
jgi:IS30 family transposase